MFPFPVLLDYHPWYLDIPACPTDQDAGLHCRYVEGSWAQGRIAVLTWPHGSQSYHHREHPRYSQSHPHEEVQGWDTVPQLAALRQ